MKFTTMYC